MRTEASPATRNKWLAAGLAIALAVLAWTPWLDASAEGYYEQAFKRALVTFALARALNGVISVVQGTELSLQPAGVGVTLAPGEIVDPLNDLIERFSWVMLAASTSLGIQKVLMDISAWWGISVVLGLGALAWLVLRLRPAERHWRAAVQRFFLLALFLRFAMPLMVVLNNAVYDAFMAEDYERSRQVVVETTADLEALNADDQPASPIEPSGWFASLRAWFSEQAASLDLDRRMAEFQHKMTAAIEHLLKLTAVFILQTIIFPLMFLWLLGKAIANLGRVVWMSR